MAGASLRSVVRELNDAGHRTAWDKEWTPVAARDMLRRPRNAGLTSYGTETFSAAWPAIVPEATWRAVVSILSDPQRRTSPGNRVKWLGSGLYVCGVSAGNPRCGSPTPAGARPPTGAKPGTPYELSSTPTHHALDHQPLHHQLPADMRIPSAPRPSNQAAGGALLSGLTIDQHR